MTEARITRRLFTAGGAATVAGTRPVFPGPHALAHCEARYIDPAGDDDSDGCTPATAWRSPERLVTLDPDMACRLRLRRGGTWTDPVRASSRRLEIEPYGSGPNPVIDLGRSLGPVHRMGPLKEGVLWRVDVAVAPLQVLASGRHMTRTAPGEIDRPGQWYWTDEAVTVATTSREVPPDIIGIMHERGIDGRGHDTVTISDISIRHAVYGVDADNAASCRISGSEFHGCFVNGIRASAATPRIGLTIRANRFTETAGTAIAFGGRIGSVAVSGNFIQDVALIADAADAPAFAWTAAIKNWGWGEAGWQGRVVVSGNDISSCGPRDAAVARPEHGHGIWIDEVVSPRERHSVAFNRVSGCASRGIYVEKSDDVDVDYNLVHDCARTRGTGALALQANRYGYDVDADAPAFVAGRCRRNRLRHNSVAGGDLALEVVAEDPGCELSDNLVQDNVLTGLVGGQVQGASILCRGGGANDGRHGTGNRYASNCIGPRRGLDLIWNGAAPAFSDTLHGDPGFVNALAGDLRLRSGSPCLDRAMSAPRPRDLDGRAVPHGSRADLGCHEGPVSTPPFEMED